jgi:environmental stress-induced protein Ves
VTAVIISPSSWRAQPWRNGAGTTYELVREPAEPAPFDVRISVAAIERPAPFSAFPGYGRALVLVDGGPVTLELDGRSLVLAAPGDAVEFAGDARVAATAVAGPSRDLNFMIRDGVPWRARALHGPAQLAAERIGVFALAGPIGVGDAHLAPLDFAWCTGIADITVRDGGLAIALLVRPR